jgi:hypothetical protein
LTILVIVAVAFAWLAGFASGAGIVGARSARQERRAYREGLADGMRRARAQVLSGRTERQERAARASAPGKRSEPPA